LDGDVIGCLVGEVDDVIVVCRQLRLYVGQKVITPLKPQRQAGGRADQLTEAVGTLSRVEG